MNVVAVVGGLAGWLHPNVTNRRRDPADRRLAMGFALSFAVCTMAGAGPASAQLMEGYSTLVAPFAIEVDGQVVGQVVVVGGKNTDPPSGYAAGTEYWTWSAGRPWRGAFTLVPRRTIPSYAALTWQTFPHERFDLSRTVAFPAVSLAGNDVFYQVQIAAGTGWIDQGYMWLDVGSPTVQTWFGIGLTTDLVGNGGRIRFRSVEPPAASSADVYLLQRPGTGRAAS